MRAVLSRRGRLLRAIDDRDSGGRARFTSSDSSPRSSRGARAGLSAIDRWHPCAARWPSARQRPRSETDRDLRLESDAPAERGHHIPDGSRQDLWIFGGHHALSRPAECNARRHRSAWRDRSDDPTPHDRDSRRQALPRQSSERGRPNCVRGAATAEDSPRPASFPAPFASIRSCCSAVDVASGSDRYPPPRLARAASGMVRGPGVIPMVFVGTTGPVTIFTADTSACAGSAIATCSASSGVGSLSTTGMGAEGSVGGGVNGTPLAARGAGPDLGGDTALFTKKPCTLRSQQGRGFDSTPRWTHGSSSRTGQSRSSAETTAGSTSTVAAPRPRHRSPSHS